MTTKRIPAVDDSGTNSMQELIRMQENQIGMMYEILQVHEDMANGYKKLYPGIPHGATYIQNVVEDLRFQLDEAEQLPVLDRMYALEGFNAAIASLRLLRPKLRIVDRRLYELANIPRNI